MWKRLVPSVPWDVARPVPASRTQTPVGCFGAGRGLQQGMFRTVWAGGTDLLLINCRSFLNVIITFSGGPQIIFTHCIIEINPVMRSSIPQSV